MSSKSSTLIFEVKFQAQKVRVEFDAERTLGELTDHIKKHFDLKQCKLVGIRIGPKVVKKSPASCPLKHFKVRNPQRVRVVGTSMTDAKIASRSEKMVLKRQMKLQTPTLKRERSSEDGYFFLYETWQNVLMKNLHLESCRAGPWLKKLANGEYGTCYGSRWETVDPVVTQPCDLVLKSAIASGNEKLLNYVITKHEPTQEALKRAAEIACSMGMDGMLLVIWGYLEEVPETMVTMLCRQCVHHLHLSLLKSIQGWSGFKLPKLLGYWVQVPSDKRFWPLVRELISHLLSNGVLPGPIILRATLSQNLLTASMQTLMEDLEVCTEVGGKKKKKKKKKKKEETTTSSISSSSTTTITSNDFKRTIATAKSNVNRRQKQLPMGSIEEGVDLSIRIALALGYKDIFHVLWDKHRSLKILPMLTKGTERQGRAMDEDGDDDNNSNVNDNDDEDEKSRSDEDNERNYGGDHDSYDRQTRQQLRADDIRLFRENVNGVAYAHQHQFRGIVSSTTSR